MIDDLRDRMAALCKDKDLRIQKTECGPFALEPDLVIAWEIMDDTRQRGIRLAITPDLLRYKGVEGAWVHVARHVDEWLSRPSK
jgi:hypothetical protein